MYRLLLANGPESSLVVICVVACSLGWVDLQTWTYLFLPLPPLSSAYYINHVTSAHSNLFIAEFANESSPRHSSTRRRRLLSSSILKEEEEKQKRHEWIRTGKFPIHGIDTGLPNSLLPFDITNKSLSIYQRVQSCSGAGAAGCRLFELKPLSLLESPVRSLQLRFMVQFTITFKIQLSFCSTFAFPLLNCPRHKDRPLTDDRTNEIVGSTLPPSLPRATTCWLSGH